MGRNTSGTLIRRGHNYSLKYIIGGKERVVSLGTANRKEADRKRDELLGSAVRARTAEELAAHIGAAKGLIHLCRIPLDAAWQAYLNSPTRPDSGEGTLGEYESAWRRFSSWCASNHPDVANVSDIDEKAAGAYVKFMVAAGRAPRTVKANAQAISLVTRTLTSDAGEKVDPFERVTLPRSDTKSRNALSKEKALELLHAAMDAGEDMELLIKLGLFAGLRLADAAGLIWGAVDTKSGILRIRPRKTSHTSGAGVVVPLHPVLANSLNRRQQGIDSEYVMPVIAKMHAENPTGLCRRINALFEAVGLSNVQETGRSHVVARWGFHALRHSFVSFCASAGVSGSIVQKLVGHSNPAMTEHYHHLDSLSAGAAIAKINIGGELKINLSLPDVLEMVRKADDLQKLKADLGLT